MTQVLTRKASTKDVPVQSRAGSLVPSTFNEADNTVDVVFSAGASVTRTDWLSGMRYEESLEVSASAIDLSRIEAGVVQILDNHDLYTGVRSVLGIVVRAWIEGGKAMATLKLSADPSKAGIVADIKAGVIRAISVGYSVQRYEVDESADIPKWTATRWMPQELSFVTVPADAGASTRSAPAQRTEPCEFLTRGAAASTAKEPSMAVEDQGAGQPVATTATVAAPAAVVSTVAPSAAPAAVDEATRAADISDLCTRHAVPHLAAQLIRSRATIGKAKDDILNAIAVRDAASGARQNQTQIAVVGDEAQTRMQGMEGALLSRLLPGHKLDDNARQYRHLSLVEMGREHMERSNISTRGMSKMDIARNMLSVRAAGMHSTSDFGTLFTNVASRRLAAAYTGFAASYAEWARRGPNLSDFKPVQVVSMGAGPDLLKVNEHGEFKYGTFGDGSETYQLATYGRIVAMTRQAIINDDLRGFDRLIGMFGTSAKRLENSLVYQQLVGNPTMGDGVALFHANHNNLLTGAGSALSLEGLTAARAKLRTQKGIAGESINLAPKFLVVPSALETLAYQLTSNAFMPTSQAGVNEFAAGGRTALTVIVDPLLDAASTTAWYLLAESALIDTVEYAYLDGADGPVTETREGFEVDGTEIKCRLDFAAKALDYRGMVKANGAA